jgi:hypothetical protein
LHSVNVSNVLSISVSDASAVGYAEYRPIMGTIIGSDCSSLGDCDAAIEYIFQQCSELIIWYNIPLNNRIGLWSELGIKDNTNMTLSFYIHIVYTSYVWRDIVHITKMEVEVIVATLASAYLISFKP